MAERSLAATTEGIDIATNALTGKGWSKEELAAQVTIQGKKTTTGIGIATVKKFFSGQNVDRKYFVEICKALSSEDLKVDWEEVAGLKSAEAVAEPEQTEPDIDALVQEIRGKVYSDIDYRCGTMRVLDMEQKIGIGDIYTSVNILEKLSGRRRLKIDELLQDCDLENFDRFMLGQVRHERVPGLEAVERYDKLMILGKPGAGKTTFMKRLATLCNQGEFQAQRVPVFVTLKEFTEAPGKPGLLAYIAQQWNACGVSNTESVKAILDQGSVLILLDGLDEVQETDHDRVLQEIKSFTDQFRQCQFVITCRIAAREYTFEQFTEVEVADFNREQIEEFATKWFKTKQDPEKGENFIKRLKDNKPIQELATNPLLLTLLCLVFGDGNDFPANRAELYKEGLDVLLKKWDAKRNIERDQIYRKLSLKRKEDLLSQLAFKTFERGDYFFEQSVVEQQIIDYIRNLPGAHEDEEALLLDSEAVLKSIEAQHGLLVERARRIYSFSHLTFQEYFTAKQIASPTAELNSALADLAAQISKKRYHEIFLLTTEMLPEADDLLLLMKRQIDQLIADDLDLQTLLTWVDKKSKTVTISHKPAAIRAFYLALDCTFTLALAFNLSCTNCNFVTSEENDYFTLAEDSIFTELNRILVYANASNHGIGIAFTLDHDCILDYALKLALILILDLYFAFDDTLDLYHIFVFVFESCLDCSFNLMDDQERNLFRDCAFAYDLARILKLAIEKTNSSNAELRAKIEVLEAQLPRLRNNIYSLDPEMIESYRQWWKVHGGDWTRNLRAVMIEHRDISHDWQFTDVQLEHLKQYFKANKLLVGCLNSDCYVKKATRQHIEDTLLLPISEIEKYERPVPL